MRLFWDSQGWSTLLKGGGKVHEGFLPSTDGEGGAYLFGRRHLLPLISQLLGKWQLELISLVFFTRVWSQQDWLSTQVVFKEMFLGTASVKKLCWNLSDDLMKHVFDTHTDWQYCSSGNYKMSKVQLQGQLATGLALPLSKSPSQKGNKMALADTHGFPVQAKLGPPLWQLQQSKRKVTCLNARRIFTGKKTYWDTTQYMFWETLIGS